mmetsp:Transcript_36262/g.78356  ORF Transcript_36262/g.78356 Transcript_36262/m.78356 type:complete len:323 (+) Transcript_36262:1-969(+)
MAFGTFERDASVKMLKKYPLLYRVGQTNQLFNWSRFLTFAFGAVIHSAIIYFVSMAADNTIQFQDGKLFGLWSMGTNACSNLVIVVTFVMTLETRCFTAVNDVFYIGSVIVWFVFLWCYHALPPGAVGSFDVRDNIYYVIFNEMNTPVYWLSMLLVTALCILPIFGWKYVRTPEPVDAARYHFRKVAPHEDVESASRMSPRSMEADTFMAPAATRPKAAAAKEPAPADLGAMHGQQGYEAARKMLDGDASDVEGVELAPLRPNTGAVQDVVGEDEMAASEVAARREEKKRRQRRPTSFHVGDGIEEAHKTGFNFTPAPPTRQ